MGTKDGQKDRSFAVQALRGFCQALFQRAGMPQERAAVIAEILVEGDLLGHSTHGLKLVGPYLKEIQAGRMALDGEPQVVSDRGSVLVLDGGYLPGPWLLVQALETGFRRIKENPVMTVVIRRSHHIACLGAYLARIAERGLLGIIASSDPNHRSVTPFGGYTACYSPHPIAAAIPTGSEPILIDMSTSCTANGVVAQYRERNKKLPRPWLLNNRGEATDDPNALFDDPPGAIMPLGGEDLGYKGYALGLLVEALTAALGGFGRADAAAQWGGAVYLQLLDPGAFAGLESFVREVSFLAAACQGSKALPAAKAGRLPGYFELRSRERQLASGVSLSAPIVESLAQWAAELQVVLPAPLED